MTEWVGFKGQQTISRTDERHHAPKIDDNN
jgi:hypothetical protein